MKLKLPKTIEKYRDIIEDIEYASPWSNELWKFNILLKEGYSWSWDPRNNGIDGNDCIGTEFFATVKEALEALRKVNKCECEKCHSNNLCAFGKKVIKMLDSAN